MEDHPELCAQLESTLLANDELHFMDDSQAPNPSRTVRVLEQELNKLVNDNGLADDGVWDLADDGLQRSQGHVAVLPDGPHVTHEIEHKEAAQGRHEDGDCFHDTDAM